MSTSYAVLSVVSASLCSLKLKQTLRRDLIRIIKSVTSSYHLPTCTCIHVVVDSEPVRRDLNTYLFARHLKRIRGVA